jgi:folylpolyglutamate synthase/dihydropteroate synthase
MAVNESKDAASIVEPFVSLPGTFVFTSFEAAGRSATRPQRLASIAADLGVWGRAITDPVEAFAIARRNADAQDIVVVTGSTFVVAELRDWWFANAASSV